MVPRVSNVGLFRSGDSLGAAVALNALQSPARVGPRATSAGKLNSSTDRWQCLCSACTHPRPPKHAHTWTHTSDLRSFPGPRRHHASQSGRRVGPLGTGCPAPRWPHCPLFVKGRAHPLDSATEHVLSPAGPLSPSSGGHHWEGPGSPWWQSGAGKPPAPAARPLQQLVHPAVPGASGGRRGWCLAAAPPRRGHSSKANLP